MVRCWPVSISVLGVTLLILCLISWTPFLFMYNTGTSPLLYLTSIRSAPLTSDIHPGAKDTPSTATHSRSNAAGTPPVIHPSGIDSHPPITNMAPQDVASHIDNTNVPTNSKNDDSKATNTPRKEKSNPANTYPKIKGAPSKTSNTPSKTKTNQPKAKRTLSKIKQEKNKSIKTLSKIKKGQIKTTNPHASRTTMNSMSHPHSSSSSPVSSEPAGGSDGECSEEYQEEGPMRQVVIWTPFWHKWNLWENMLRDHAYLKEGRCAIWRCEFLLGQNFTTEQIKEADAIIFFSLDVMVLPLPPRFPHTLWIWLELESPVISKRATESWRKLEASGVFFNLTMSYHHLNPIVAFLGELVPLTTPQHCPITSTFFLNTSSPTYTSYSHHMNQFESWLLENGVFADEKLRAERNRRHGSLIYQPKDNSSLPEPLSDGRGEKEAQGKEKVMEEGNLTFTSEEIALATRPRVAVWMASHCPTDSRREDLVAALQGFMSVTTVGKCGKMKCGKNHMDEYCYRWIAASHLFYLSFENALCDDYKTEKLWTPMMHGMVPVVYGGASYRDTLPFDSYIDVSDFSSAAALANYLLYLATHPAAYLKYLQWRRYWQVRRLVPWCDLCTAIHRQTHPLRSTLDQWWNNTATCEVPPRWR
ncbi:Alpha-(1,3)-fucosyltransferase C [Portunus trituberculatus]|uniref:Fucosyltransferase n=1 Tax=Portunus trituberculatus TaxID=210409 RepID=A0A5B7E0W5_PORTR|nr:Alpha-(1,3)-fucosyltransferase C [Portunus trituberculatus]